MSLLRLLTTGKSLVGLKDLQSRYRPTTQRLLPQFGPRRNPFSSNGKAESAQTEPRVPRNDGGKGVSAEGRGGTDSSEATGAALESEARVPTASTNASVRRFTEVLRLRAAALLRGCKGKLTGMIRRVRVKEVKPAIPRFTKPAVQGELSLDKIEVMRNDLSDADLEVVAAQLPTTLASSESALQTDKDVRVEERRWGRATAGLYGAGKT